MPYNRPRPAVTDLTALTDAEVHDLCRRIRIRLKRACRDNPRIDPPQDTRFSVRRNEHDGLDIVISEIDPTWGWRSRYLAGIGIYETPALNRMVNKAHTIARRRFRPGTNVLRAARIRVIASPRGTS